MSDDRSGVPREYHRPVQRPASTFDRRFGSTDPAEVSRAAHATASALLTRVRDEPSDEVVDRLVTLTDTHGIDTLAEMPLRDCRIVIEAEFDTGAVKNAMILSVPEGHDKPLKYPLMFQVCDVVLVNKIDVLPYFDFDMDKCREYVALRNPNARVIPICARTGEGIDEWADWLKAQVRAWQA